MDYNNHKIYHLDDGNENKNVHYIFFYKKIENDECSECLIKKDIYYARTLSIRRISLYLDTPTWSKIIVRRYHKRKCEPLCYLWKKQIAQC